MSTETYEFIYGQGKFEPIKINISNEEEFLLHLGTMLEIVEDSVEINAQQKLIMLRKFASLFSTYPVMINPSESETVFVQHQ